MSNQFIITMALGTFLVGIAAVCYWVWVEMKELEKDE